MTLFQIDDNHPGKENLKQVSLLPILKHVKRFMSIYGTSRVGFESFLCNYLLNGYLSGVKSPLSHYLTLVFRDRFPTPTITPNSSF